MQKTKTDRLNTTNLLITILLRSFGTLVKNTIIFLKLFIPKLNYKIRISGRSSDSFRLLMPSHPDTIIDSGVKFNNTNCTWQLELTAAGTAPDSHRIPY
jgi:hypothetical protein